MPQVRSQHDPFKIQTCFFHFLTLFSCKPRSCTCSCPCLFVGPHHFAIRIPTAWWMNESFTVALDWAHNDGFHLKSNVSMLLNIFLPVVLTLQRNPFYLSCFVLFSLFCTRSRMNYLPVMCAEWIHSSLTYIL